MNTSRIPSPARSLGVISTPRKHTPRRSRSVCSAKSNVSVRLTKVISDSFQISPISNRRSVLNDDTDIEIPGRKSWWKKLGENSRDMMDLLDNKDIAEVNNVAEEFDVEILSQEKKNYSLDLPESSDGESINSIVIPQRKLFTQKENQVQKKFEHIIDNRETLAKLQKSHFDQEKDIDVGPKNLFNKASKPRTKPAFPAALLNVSSKAVNKTKEMPAPEVEGQVRNLFGNRPGMKRKNLFADFIVSESEDEIPDIQPKVFGFQKNAQKRCENSASRGVGHSPTSSIDLELDDWKLLPSSTMVENQFEEATTPIKRAKLSKLSEAKESETMNTNSTVNKTRQSNKSATSKNKSKTSMSKLKDKKDEELLSASKTKEDLLKSKNNLSLNTSSNVRMTRNKSKSIESPLKVEEHTKLHNKSKNKSQSHLITPMEVQEGDKNTENNEIIMKTGLNQQDFEKQNKNVAAADAPEEDDEDFTLEYDNDDEQVNEPLAADNIENKSNENINLIDEERNKTQSNKDKLDDVHVEKQKDDNKQQYFNTSLIKNFNKQNKSADKVKEINRSQSKGKQKQSLSDSQKNNSRKSKNVTLDEVHQKTKNESRIEKDKMDTEEKNVTNDIENTDEGENINESTQHNESTQRNDSSKTNDEIDSQNETDETDEENEQQNESQQLGNENEEQRESTDSNDDNEIRNKSKESEAEIKERNESTQLDHEREQQNESSQSNNDIQNESIQSDVENEIEQENNHEDVDETIIEAEEEETENEQDESEDEQKTEEQVQQDESEAEQETEEHIPQNESENNNSKNQEQSDSKSNHSETEEQENEAMEIEHEEEYESDLEEQNETENQESETENQESETENQESENYDSDDNLQNESNLSKNDEQEEQVESDQVQNEDVREENEVIETFNHDATLRNKKKDPTIVKSPEVILHDKTNQMESFTTEGRNTSIRKTKSIIKNLNIKPSLAPVRESTGFSDGTRDSSAEGSGWDSHRTTRKTIRLTLGKDFTPRKSLRALVMEKSAKRHTNINEVTTKVPQANSTELPAFDSYEDAAEMNEMVEEPSDHEISARTRQTTLENYLQKIKQENLEKKRKMEEEIRASLKAPTRDIFNPFKVPLKPVRRIKPVQNKPRPKQTKPSAIPLNMLPPEVLEDMKYKPPKRFQPSNASWITKRLYKFLENKLEPKYDYKARIRAERLVELLYGFTREIKRGPSDQAIDTLKKEMARLEIVKTHFDFYEFFHEFMPREIRVKVVPDIVNKISLPRGGVFSEILQ